MSDFILMCPFLLCRFKIVFKRGWIGCLFPAELTTKSSTCRVNRGGGGERVLLSEPNFVALI